jgi:hypothetical protein
MTFQSFDSWWWPYLFILIAGWAATDVWRFLGVQIGSRISETSDLMVLVRCIATALVAGVAASFVLAPGGALADVPLALRIGATATCFVAYLATGRSILLGVLAGEAVLVGGIMLSG